MERAKQGEAAAAQRVSEAQAAADSVAREKDAAVRTLAVKDGAVTSAKVKDAGTRARTHTHVGASLCGHVSATHTPLPHLPTGRH